MEPAAQAQHERALAAQVAAMAPGSLQAAHMEEVLVAPFLQPATPLWVALAPAASSGVMAGPSPAPTQLMWAPQPQLQLPHQPLPLLQLPPLLQQRMLDRLCSGRLAPTPGLPLLV
jgi:hypothetical protein